MLSACLAHFLSFILYSNGKTAMSVLTPLLEYYTSSSLFMSSSGVFLILTDSTELINRDELKEDDYYSWIGSYVDLIANTASKAKVQPKIQLVPSKVQPENRPQITKACETILEITKEHLEAADADIPFFLVDEVMEISSKHVTQELPLLHHSRDSKTPFLHKAPSLRCMVLIGTH